MPKVIDEALLATYRLKTHCELCGTRLRYPAHPHHVRAKGMGGGGRLDIAINLIALGGPWEKDCNCHGRLHDGNIPREAVLEVVARREGLSVEELNQKLDEARRV